jgi:hypothetical protein
MYIEEACMYMEREGTRELHRTNSYLHVRFEAFTAVTMTNVVFWDVAQRHISQDDILQVSSYFNPSKNILSEALSLKITD